MDGFGILIFGVYCFVWVCVVFYVVCFTTLVVGFRAVESRVLGTWVFEMDIDGLGSGL